MSKEQSSRREFLALAGAATTATQLRAQPSEARSPFQFLVVGDWGRNGQFHQQEVADAMGEFHQAALIVSTGDNFYEHGVGSIRDPKWDSSFNRIYTKLPQRWYSVLGNHDYAGDVEAQISRTFHDPRWRMPDYWFDVRLTAYGRPDIHLFFINTVAWRGREKFFFGVLGSSVRRTDPRLQREWLAQRLSRSDAALKIVFGHHPVYSVRGQGSYYGMPDLDGLLFDHGVTAYVNGHDHCMYHISAPDRRGKAPERVHYLCSGAGSKMRPVEPPFVQAGLASDLALPATGASSARPVWHAFFTKSAVASRNLEGGFAAFEVHGSELKIRFIEPRPDLRNGTAWRERYAAAIPIRGV